MTEYSVIIQILLGSLRVNKYTYIHIHTYIHTYIHTEVFVTSIIDPPWEDPCEWHRMTQMTRPDCAVMCILINIHTYINKYMFAQRFS